VQDTIPADYVNNNLQLNYISTQEDSNISNSKKSTNNAINSIQYSNSNHKITNNNNFNNQNHLNWALFVIF
jgi:hypothetical protein